MLKSPDCLCKIVMITPMIHEPHILLQILELVKQGHVGLRCEDELGDPTIGGPKDRRSCPIWEQCRDAMEYQDGWLK